VEDNVVNMHIAISMLKKLGFGADSAENGLEAISMLHRTDYDIILMVRLLGSPRSG
jgi:CheY-like chemotaxis protein